LGPKGSQLHTKYKVPYPQINGSQLHIHHFKNKTKKKGPHTPKIK